MSVVEPSEEAGSNTEDQAPDLSAASAARGGALTAIGSVLSMILNFGIIIVVTRTYGADGAGVFFSVLALFALVGTSAKLGAETGLVYSVSRYLALGRDRDVVPTIRLALLPALLLAFALGGVGVAGSSVIGDWFSDEASAEQFALVVRNVSLLLPAYVAVHVLSGATRGLGVIRPTVYGISVGRPALQVVPIAAVAGAGLGVGALGLAWAIPLALTAVGMYFWLNRLLDEQGTPRVVMSPSPGLAREFWSYAAPRGLANTLQNAQDRVGILVVSALSVAGTAGVFVTVARLIGALHLFGHAVGQALNPQLSGLVAAQNRHGANRLLQRISAWTALPIVPVCLGLLVFPEAALSIFGAEFERGASALAVLAATSLLTSPLVHVDNVLLMGGRSRTSLLDVAASLVTTLVALFLLVPPHGVLGAAIGWSIGLGLYALLPLWQGWRQLGLQPFGPEVGVVITAIVPGAVFAVGARLIVGTEVFAAGIGCAGALLAYAGVLHRRRHTAGLAELTTILRERSGRI